MSVSDTLFFSRREKALIRLLQEDLPVCPEPYQEIAARLGLKQEEVLAAVGRWVDCGVIRRFGATVRHFRMGYEANCMVVWKVDELSDHREAGALFATFPQVTHCYRRPPFRDWPYTLYTMVHGRSREEIDNTLAKMSAASGLKDYRLLFSVREWKKTSMKYFSEKEQDR
ncbi:MAG TPA: Lrp/AsnC family transcriptional regulator [archaeon]|nr:Lrp/AsnC family transcriptional regulator [archaeon]